MDGAVVKGSINFRRQVVECLPGKWLVVGVQRTPRDSFAVLVSIPEGETAEGFGRRWFEDGRETRIVPMPAMSGPQ